MSYTFETDNMLKPSNIDAIHASTEKAICYSAAMSCGEGLHWSLHTPELLFVQHSSTVMMSSSSRSIRKKCSISAIKTCGLKA